MEHSVSNDTGTANGERTQGGYKATVADIAADTI